MTKVKLKTILLNRLFKSLNIRATSGGYGFGELNSANAARAMASITMYTKNASVQAGKKESENDLSAISV